MGGDFVLSEVEEGGNSQREVGGWGGVGCVREGGVSTLLLPGMAMSMQRRGESVLQKAMMGVLQ